VRQHFQEQLAKTQEDARTYCLSIQDRAKTAVAERDQQIVLLQQRVAEDHARLTDAAEKQQSYAMEVSRMSEEYQSLYARLASDGATQQQLAEAHQQQLSAAGIAAEQKLSEATSLAAAERERLEERLRQAEHQLNSTVAAMEMSSADNASSGAQLAAVSQERDQLKHAIDQQGSRHTQIIDMLQQQLEDAKREREDALLSKLTAEQQLAAAGAQADQQAAMGEQLAQKDAAAEELRQKLAASETLRETLQKQLGEAKAIAQQPQANADAAAMSLERQELSKKLAQAQQQLQEQMSQRQALAAEHEAVKAQLTALSVDNAQIGATESLTRKLQEAALEKQVMEGVFREQMEETQKSLSAKTIEAESLKRQIKELSVGAAGATAEAAVTGAVASVEQNKRIKQLQAKVTAVEEEKTIMVNQLREHVMQLARENYDLKQNRGPAANVPLGPPGAQTMDGEAPAVKPGWLSYVLSPFLTDSDMRELHAEAYVDEKLGTTTENS
jgi:hypothetical protein